MEELIEQFPTVQEFNDSIYKSKVYQPDLVAISSLDNTLPSNNPFAYAGFSVRLARPCLNVKKVRLIRAAIPTPLPSLTDSQLFFWYYRYTNASVPSSVADLNLNNLYFVRLQPSWVPPEIVGTQYAYNRTFTSYDDLVYELNRATTNEWLSLQGVQQWISGDITFGYDTRFNKITVTGNNSAYTYIIAGQNDKNITTIFNSIVQPSINLYTPVTGWFGAPNPKSNTSLNYRLGFTWTGGNLTTFIGSGGGSQLRNDFYNMMRPVPYSTYWTQAPYPSATRTMYAQTYANLVNTQNITISVDWAGSSSQDSAGNSGILAVVPLNAANNSVGFFNNIPSDYLEKIPTQIHEVRVSFKDDAGNDLYLPNTAVVTMDLGFSYL